MQLLIVLSFVSEEGLGAIAIFSRNSLESFVAIAACLEFLKQNSLQTCTRYVLLLQCYESAVPKTWALFEYARSCKAGC